MIRISNFLAKVDYKHIYRERNTKADALANAGANVIEGHWKILEYRGADTYETFQIFKVCLPLSSGGVGAALH